ncbi:hypothetical protein SADUNF_Sadunf06G0182500 [Salix dunnii]|uniref:Uncharacterized protein n=1 Tax=Salix dunnii TaxID=1413687 RepID=A0A835N381_9ROSI|nr:hypothetical protein SADUNF_Sadunf06G0182500 [Salix dunnii]
MEEESLILPESDVTDEYMTDFDLDGDLSPGYPIKEEMIEEVMQDLYKEITCTKSATLDNVPSPLFVDNGKSESCGASVSDFSSTVMAGVEFVGVAGKIAGGDSGLPGKRLSEERRGFDFGEGYLAERMMIDGRDGVEFGDDQWLDRVLMGWGPVEVEGWT